MHRFLIVVADNSALNPVTTWSIEDLNTKDQKAATI